MSVFCACSGSGDVLGFCIVGAHDNVSDCISIPPGRCPNHVLWSPIDTKTNEVSHAPVMIRFSYCSGVASRSPTDDGVKVGQ